MDSTPVRDSHIRYLEVPGDSGSPPIPVYSLRLAAHHEPIARALAAGKTAAFYGGLYGIVKGIGPVWSARDDAEIYWRIKNGRPRWSKVPLFIEPRHAVRLIDFELVHAEYRHLRHRERFAALWEAHGGPLHVIAPLRQPLRFLNPAFETRVDDLRSLAANNAHARDRLVACTTASFMWMPDPDWHSLAVLAGLYSQPRTFYGVSSFNDHGEQPPYTYAELNTYVRSHWSDQFDLVINDELYESTGAFSSHTQVRLPLVGETSELVVIRHGSVSPAWLSAATGYPVRVLASTAIASRAEGLSDADLQSGIERLQRLRRRYSGVRSPAT